MEVNVFNVWKDKKKLQGTQCSEDVDGQSFQSLHNLFVTSESNVYALWCSAEENVNNIRYLLSTKTTICGNT